MQSQTVFGEVKLMLNASISVQSLSLYRILYTFLTVPTIRNNSVSQFSLTFIVQIQSHSSVSKSLHPFFLNFFMSITGDKQNLKKLKPKLEENYPTVKSYEFV